MISTNHLRRERLLDRLPLLDGEEQWFLMVLL
jgi:hypothetical protein